MDYARSSRSRLRAYISYFDEYVESASKRVKLDGEKHRTWNTGEIDATEMRHRAGSTTIKQDLRRRRINKLLRVNILCG